MSWPSSSVDYSAILIHQGRGFDPRSRHIQECINKWNNKLVFLFLPLLLLFKTIDKENLK